MNDDNNLYVFSDFDHNDAVVENHKNQVERKKKKKDYKNRAKWKIRKEMKQKNAILETNRKTNNGDIIREYIDQVVVEQPDIVREYLEPVEKRQDIVREYIEPIEKKQDIVKEYLEPNILGTKVTTNENDSPSMDLSSQDISIQPSALSGQEVNHERVTQSAVSTYDIRRVYINFQTRVAVLLSGILVLFGVACYLIISTLQQYAGRKVSYIETSNVKYEVCEKSSTACLQEKNNYQADTVSTVKIQYSYDASFAQDVEANLSYYVVAVHKIFDAYDPNKIAYEQEENLTQTQKIQSIDSHAQIDVETIVDFQKYYGFVYNYQTKYSNISNSSLSVLLYVDDGSSSHIVGEVYIPLSNKQFQIETNHVEEISQEYSYRLINWSRSSVISVLVGCGLVLLSLLLLFHFTKLILALAGRKSKYQQYLMMILREYDRLIVNATDPYVINPNKKLIKVYSFDELLTIHSTLDKPIVFSKINNVKSEFVMEDNEIVYKFVLKEADMEV